MALTIVGGQVTVIKKRWWGLTGEESEKMEEIMELWKGLEHGAATWCGVVHTVYYYWFWR